MKPQKRLRLRSRPFSNGEGFDFVRCRICGDHRRVISGRHLSKHGTDREEYMEEYGLSPDELIAKDFRIIQSSRRGYQPYGKREWIAAIKKIRNNGGSIRAGDLPHKNQNLYQLAVWVFGDYDKALSAAGFDPQQMRLRRFWDKEKIVQELRRMRGQNLPLYPKCVMNNHRDLFHGALRQYGSWNKALIAAGITVISRRTRLGLLRELRDAVETRSEVSPTLRSKIEYYFGSLRAAQIALKTDRRLLNGWSKPKIITVLAHMHRSKEKLNYATGRREFPALVSAAEAYFGSWGKALYAAGIDPNLYFVHHKWRKSRAQAVHT